MPNGRWSRLRLVRTGPLSDIPKVSENVSDEIVTYWLIPAEPARSYFRSLIRDLAIRCDAPVFEPHVTLYVTEAAAENPAEVIQSVLGEFRPIRLAASGLDCAEKFTKTLFVQFDSNAAVTELSERLRSASVSRREYELNPHLSLIYKSMPSEAKRELMNSLTLEITQVEFDAVMAVISPAKIESRQDVEAWRMVATERLTA